MNHALNTDARAFILFRVGDTYWAADVASVQRVHRLASVNDVPGTQPWFLGLAHIDGELLSVTDLGAWLNQTPCVGPVLQLYKHLGIVGLRVDEVFNARTLTPSTNSLNANEMLMPGALTQTVEYELATDVEADVTTQTVHFRVIELRLLVQSPAFVAIRETSAV